VSRFAVTLFARYAELFGTSRLEIELAEPATVAGLVDALRQLPGGASLPASPFVAVNLAQAREVRTIAPADEIALLPPLAGG
jgi:molybdopterin converting factor small subunit